jgi:hypothetical protein
MDEPLHIAAGDASGQGTVVRTPKMRKVELRGY